MTKILVLYHSMYGHIERMARAEAEGAGEVAGTEVVIKRVPETMSDEAVQKVGGKLGSSQRSRVRTNSRTTTRSSSERPRASAT